MEKRACGTHIYVDPVYDVTKQVVADLNKTYIPQKFVSKSKKKSFSPVDMLHEAILSNSKRDITLAIRAGASLDRGKGSKSPLFWAITFKKSEAINYLLECGVDVKQSFIQLAINQGDIKSALLFAEKCEEAVDTIYSLRNLRGTLLQFAVSYHDWITALSLVKKGANFSCNLINSDKITIMDAIIHWGSDLKIKTELIQELINRGYKASEIWASAIKFGLDGIYINPTIIKLFVKNGVDPNCKIQDPWVKGAYWTPLMRAINTNSLLAVKALLDAGANINQKCVPSSDLHRFLQTPLTFAIDLNRKEIVALLLERGAL